MNLATRTTSMVDSKAGDDTASQSSPSRIPDGDFGQLGGRDISRLPESHVDSTSNEHSLLTQTTDSLVTFILNSLQGLGSNLPGIGAVGVVLSIKDKFLVSCTPQSHETCIDGKALGRCGE